MLWELHHYLNRRYWNIHNQLRPIMTMRPMITLPLSEQRIDKFDKPFHMKILARIQQKFNCAYRGHDFKPMVWVRYFNEHKNDDVFVCTRCDKQTTFEKQYPEFL